MSVQRYLVSRRLFSAEMWCTCGHCMKQVFFKVTLEGLQQGWRLMLCARLGRVVPAYGMLVARALVKPTRLVCLPPEVELSNRVVRHFR